MDRPSCSERVLMIRLIVSLLSGLLFGFGLALAQMTNPLKVLGFLDMTGNWDPSLLFVLGGAVGVTVVSFHFILRRSAPLFEPSFHLSSKKNIDRSLVVGAALFGIGWGISGYCPGPAITLLAVNNRETILFLPAIVAGILLHRLFASKIGQRGH